MNVYMMYEKPNGIYNIYHRINEIYRKIDEVHTRFQTHIRDVNHSTKPEEYPNSEQIKIDEHQRESNTFRATTDPSKRKIKAFIDYISREQGVSPALVQAIAEVESNLNPNAISPKGAIGIMQLMPQTAKELNVNPYNVYENIQGGIEYLKRLALKYRDLDLVLAAYNAGPANVEKYKGIPPYLETKNYVNKIKKILNQLED